MEFKLSNSNVIVICITVILCFLLHSTPKVDKPEIKTAPQSVLDLLIPKPPVLNQSIPTKEEPKTWTT